jgi:hypothetical protein
MIQTVMLNSDSFTTLSTSKPKPKFNVYPHILTKVQGEPAVSVL